MVVGRVELLTVLKQVREMVVGRVELLTVMLGNLNFFFTLHEFINVFNVFYMGCQISDPLHPEI